jgi:hypothetical protein
MLKVFDMMKSEEGTANNAVYDHKKSKDERTWADLWWVLECF